MHAVSKTHMLETPQHLEEERESWVGGWNVADSQVWKGCSNLSELKPPKLQLRERQSIHLWPYSTKSTTLFRRLRQIPASRSKPTTNSWWRKRANWVESGCAKVTAISRNLNHSICNYEMQASYLDTTALTYTISKAARQQVRFVHAASRSIFRSKLKPTTKCWKRKRAS